MVLVLCLLSDDALYLYSFMKISKRVSQNYSADNISNI